MAATKEQVRKPHLVVGIDFGMTCTGVAYANLTRGETVRTIQKWPGRSMANENKVPTIVVYSRGTRQISSWGFSSESITEQSSIEKLYIDWFKVYLDEDLLAKLKSRDPTNLPESIEMVETWFIDYLSRLYEHIEFKLSQELQDLTWSEALVEFIFSVPVTWKPYPTIERFRSVLLRAGYNKHASHSIQVGLTEAEAAAVSTLVEAPGIFQLGENMIICDVGGGTSDLTIMTFQSDGLKQLDVVMGRNIGSANIDVDFQDLIEQRLSAADQTQPLGIEIEDAAWAMMKSKEYQNTKCDHGSPDETPFFFVPVPLLSPAYSNEAHGLRQGSLKLSQQDLKNMFDGQIAQLYELIDRQIDKFQLANPNKAISHLILSGGLGNNAYVQDCLRKKYQHGSSRSAAVSNLKIHVAPDPQLAVSRGIVHDRVRRLNTGKHVLGWRCARASYGSICKVPYHAKNTLHQTSRHAADPFDGKEYVLDAIEWFIKKGELVNSDTPIIRDFTRKLRGREFNDRKFTTKILVSYQEAIDLPFTMLSQGAQHLCDVKSDLTMIPEHKFKLKNNHWWNRGTPYRRCRYDIKLVIGPADIIFELWFDGNKISQDNPIKVEWQEAAVSSVTPDTTFGGVSDLPAISKSRDIGAVARAKHAMISTFSLPGTNHQLKGPSGDLY